MREILFRGLAKDGTGWVNGDLINYDKNDKRILPQNFRAWDIQHDGEEIIPETIGQYTGLDDKNGTKVFEGDIIENTNRHKYNNIISRHTIYIGKYDYEDTYNFSADESQHGYGVNINHTLSALYYISAGYTIIGNIHENPELLKND